MAPAITLTSFPPPSDSESLSDDSFVEKHRKRRRLSDPESDRNILKPPAEIYPTTSRIKPRSVQISQAQTPHIEETELSNGKLVDAKSSFATLEVAPWLIASLAAMEIKRPTAIQKGCIPKILAGKDVIGGSKTGSGKTVAFAVPILQKWAEDPMGIFAVILTPTRYKSQANKLLCANRLLLGSLRCKYTNSFKPYLLPRHSKQRS